jgi:hypothetical protein
MTDFLAGQRLTADVLNNNTQRIIEYAPITANSATTTTTEIVTITSDSVTFRTLRAYRITLRALAQSGTSGDTVVFRVRKTNVTGDIYLDSHRIYIGIGGAVNFPYHDAQICANFTGADVSAALVATVVRGSGAGNAFMAASATHVSYLQVEDIGSSADFTSARAIT